MSKSASAAFRVGFLRNGDRVTYDEVVYKDNGLGAVLYQQIDSVSGAVAPDWSVTANQPMLMLVPHSSNGYAVGISSVLWAYDGTNLEFSNALSDSWVAESNGKPFSAKMVDGCPVLRITGNLADASEIANKQINYTVSYVSNGRANSFEGASTVEIQAAGTSSHAVRISVAARQVNSSTMKGTGGMELGIINLNGDNYEIESTMLTANCFYAAAQITVGQSGYSLKWYRDGVELTGSEEGVTINGANLTLTRAAVNGGHIFGAALVLNGSSVAQDGQRVLDNADEYQIETLPRSVNENYVSYDQSTSEQHKAYYLAYVKKNGVKIDQTGVVFNWTIRNAMYTVMATNSVTSDGRDCTIEITPAHCMISGSSIDDPAAIFDDVDVQVTATF